MKSMIRLAWSYISAHRGQSIAMVVAVSLSLSLPLATVQMVNQYERQLLTRSGNPPLLLGPRGSRYDLILKAQYFIGQSQTPMQWSVYQAVVAAKGVRSVPVHLLHTAQDETNQVVGTVADYFRVRKISFITGGVFAHPGECVVGASVLTNRGVVRTDISNPFDLSAPPPLELMVVGRLAPTGTPDDDAIFVSMETAWILDGYGHGHEQEDQGTAPSSGSAMDGDGSGHRPTSLITKIDQTNRHKIHFHGNRDQFPVSAILIWPKHLRDGVILEGQYVDHASLQILQPDREVQRLLEYVFQVRNLLHRVFIALAGITVLLVVVIVLQSLNVRRRDLETMCLVGCSRRRVSLLIAWELLILVCGAILLALVTSAVMIEVLPSIVTLL